MSSVSPTPNAWQVLRNAGFARYMGGEAVSMLGTWMQQMAQGWVMASLTSSAFALGWVNFASTAPVLLLTMFGGVIADRYDKRVVLVLVLIAQSLLAVGIGWLVARGEIAVWHVVVASVLLGITTAFEMPSASALVPELVDKEQMSAAIAVDRSIFHATRLIGPALGGWLIGKLGTSAAFYANAVSFGALILALVTIHPRRQIRTDEEKQKSGMIEGLRYVRGDRPTLAMLSLLSLSTLFISPFFMVMMPLYSMHTLHLRPDQHGLLMGSSGVGAFVGSLWLLSIPCHQRTAYLRVAVTAIVLSMIGLSFAQGLGTAAMAMITLTLGTSTMFGIANTIVQERAPDWIRGRVSALSGLSFFGVLPFAGLLVTKFADTVGLRAAFCGSAVTYAVCAALLLYGHRHFSTEPRAIPEPVA